MNDPVEISRDPVRPTKLHARTHNGHAFLEIREPGGDIIERKHIRISQAGTQDVVFVLRPTQSKTPVIHREHIPISEAFLGTDGVQYNAGVPFMTTDSLALSSAVGHKCEGAVVYGEAWLKAHKPKATHRRVVALHDDGTAHPPSFAAGRPVRDFVMGKESVHHMGAYPDRPVLLRKYWVRDQVWISHVLVEWVE